MRRAKLILLASASLLLACSNRKALDKEALMDPAACQGCHPDAYREWSGSMHAYASDDPVFIALNAFAQRETNGEIGDLCVGCHAPMALHVGATTDGLNIEDVPRRLRGVTCYYCHQIDRIEDDHNAAFHLADDDMFRGGIGDPVDTEAHRSGTLAFHDGRRGESSALCGSCHDVRTPSGLQLENTFAEWRESVFAQGPSPVSCAGCHMPGRSGPVAEVPGAPVRRLHDHSMPGVDVALSPWPEAPEQLQAIQRDLRRAITATLCVQPGTLGPEVVVVLDNVLAGHAFPSGVTHARRAWVELVAFDGEAPILISGVVEDDEPIVELEDENLWLMRSRIFDEDGTEVHFSWRAKTMETTLLPAAVTSDPTDPRFSHSVERSYPLSILPSKVRMRVQMRPIGLEMFDEIIESGDLDPAVLDSVPTHILAGTEIEWTDADGLGCVN
ncbi:MAG: hypothetical protein GY811_00785 [Myxococcales bacterium]|nr:hypothetical protein [Myxococcales bacterium]